MKYKLLLLDIDGTLRPNHLNTVPVENVEALRAVQRVGVRVAIATGRSIAGVPDYMLNGFEPDFWLCASGAQVLTPDLKYIRDERMTLKQVEALRTYFNDRDYPYGFAFPDGVYVYKDYDIMHERELTHGGGSAGFINGEAQNKHLDKLPVAAFCRCHEEAALEFAKMFPDEGLRFLFYGREDHLGLKGCDILQPDQDKACGLKVLSAHLGVDISECVCAGDAANDEGMIRMAGIGYAMYDGAEVAKRAADRITPQGEYGVAYICREVWPEAF
ncbi:MAG: Cof-type HAD-IIB family hydrolase [Lachnospiraceae bacterium]|nr:Cof-type HAD-IIB family hydrolase [Lachnospiraceae bacterium]